MVKLIRRGKEWKGGRINCASEKKELRNKMDGRKRGSLV